MQKRLYHATTITKKNYLKKQTRTQGKQARRKYIATIGNKNETFSALLCELTSQTKEHSEQGSTGGIQMRKIKNLSRTITCGKEKSITLVNEESSQENIFSKNGTER